MDERQELSANMNDHACNDQNDSQLDQHLSQTAGHFILSPFRKLHTILKFL